MTDDSYVSIAECAERMSITEAEVMDLISSHVLRAYRYGGWGEVLVEPAITNKNPVKKRVAKKVNN